MNTRPRRRRITAVAIVALVAVLAAAGTAYAVWDGTFSPSGVAKADALATGATPNAPTTNTSNGNNVTITFSRVNTTGGIPIPAANYTIKRYPAAGGSAVTATVSCSGTTTISCSENSVPDGNWQYTDTPTYGTNWVGTESNKSAAVTVDTTPPVNNLTINVQSGNAVLVGTTLYYKGSSAGSFTITNALADSGSGPKSSTFPALGGTATNWTHTASTVSTPAGGPFVSQSFSWSAGTTSSPTELVTGTDNVSNTNTGTTLTFVNDNTAPVNNLTLSNQTGGGSFISGTTVYYHGVSGSFTITNALSDAGSGPASSSFPALGGTPTNWTHTASGTVSTPAGGPYVSTTFSWSASASSSPTEVVTGTDALGNTVTTTLTFTPDNTVPTTPTITFPTNNARYNTAGWTGNITGTASDTASGVAQNNITIQRGSDSKFWNGTTWQTGSFTLVATGTTSWSQALAASNLDDGVSYTVTATTVDNVGNASASATASFTYDTTAPTPVSVDASNGKGNPGQIDTHSGSGGNDTLTFTYSETIDSSSVTTGNVSVVFTDGGAGNDTITIPGIGTVNLGSTGWLTATSTKTESLTQSGNTFTLEITTAPTGNASGVPASNFTWSTTGGTAKDLAGNLATGSITTNSQRF